MTFFLTYMIGIKAEFGGYESTKVKFENAFSSATASANLFTYNVGPVVKFRSGHFEPFAEALFGGAHSSFYGNLCRQLATCVVNNPSNNAFDFVLGGGIDIPLSHSIAFRPVQADYVLTRFGNGFTKGNQNQSTSGIRQVFKSGSNELVQSGRISAEMMVHFRGLNNLDDLNLSSASTSLGSIRLFNRAMFKTIVLVLSALFFSLFPAPAPAQCNEQLCRNLQAILDEAVTDFRGYRANRASGPDVSIEGTAVPCQMSLWANNVPMYICYAKVPNPDSQKWYARTLQILQALNPTWHFQISSSGDDHCVDAGPADCEIPPNDGPHRGQCPLHLQTMKQVDGTSQLYLWMNSLSSPYLLKPPPPPPSKTVSSATPAAAPATAAGCDGFCQNLKKVFEARVEAFAGIRTAKGNDGTTEVTVRLAGAKQCSVKEAPGSQSNGLGTQFVCYWREASGSAAQTRFRDLVSRLQILIPSNWSTHQENELDDSTGAEITAWYAIEPGSKHDVRVYVSVESIGLHITAWN